jgi:hypothetical protein
MIWELMGVFRVAVSLEIHNTIQWRFEVRLQIIAESDLTLNSLIHILFQQLLFTVRSSLDSCSDYKTIIPSTDLNFLP